MADIPNTYSQPSFIEDDDLINVDDADVPYTFVIDPFSPLDSSLFVPPPSSSYHHHHHQVNSNLCSSDSDCADSTVYPDCLYGRDDEYDHIDFVTDLFESRREIERVSSVDVGISNNNINYHNGLGLGLEGGGDGDGDGGGLRVTRIESESDIEDLGAADADQNDDRVVNLDPVTGDERDRLSSVIERIEEISVSSDMSSEGDGSVGVLEWEILLAVNNFERDLESATEGEGFVYTPEFDTLIGQFVETVRALRGSPPAAKSFIDNLPSVVLKKGDDSNEDDNAICAVCKDGILVEERVTQLPCKHYYHGECIVPWLSIRNTCPVCRFELPTDDVDYERSKNRVDDDDDDDDGELRVGYGFDLEP